MEGKMAWISEDLKESRGGGHYRSLPFVLLSNETLQNLNIGKGGHSPIECERFGTAFVMCLGDNQAIRKSNPIFFKNSQSITHCGRGLEFDSVIIEQGEKNLFNLLTCQSITAIKRPAQFDQHDVGYEERAILTPMEIEYAFRTHGLRLVVASDKTHKNIGIESDHARRLREVTASTIPSSISSTLRGA